MARNFNTYNAANTRLVSSWLHEIPSDPGSDSEATLIEPSVYDLPAPRRRKDEVPPAQPRRQPQPQPEPRPNTPNRTPTHTKQSPYQTHNSPTRSPIRHQSQQPQTQFQLRPPPPPPSQPQPHQSYPPKLHLPTPT